MHKDECPATTWPQMVDWGITNRKGKSQIAHAFKTMFAETCHTIWLERNQRIFEGKRADVAAIIREVVYLCCTRAPPKLQTLVHTWFLTNNVFPKMKRLSSNCPELVNGVSRGNPGKSVVVVVFRDDADFTNVVIETDSTIARLIMIQEVEGNVVADSVANYAIIEQISGTFEEFHQLSA
ncbi:hypothetical protein KY284_000610 [Solanum tuberosum]|nr:hypothetical protein KY284_000610 [Solanum tuberosum]